MPFIDPPNPYTRPPREHPPVDREPWSGTVEVDDGEAMLREVSVDAPSLYLEDCDRLELVGSSLRAVSFADTPNIELEIDSCELHDVDLSRVRIRSARFTTFVGCKFVGADLSGATLRDCTIDHGILRYANLRMATLERVRFVGSVIDDVDFYESTLSDVAFPGSELAKVGIDKASFSRADVRHAASLDFTSVTDLRGLLVSDDQVISLAYLFALATGVDIERTADDRA